MFIILLFVEYLRITLNYLKSITLYGFTHMMSMVDQVTISVETPRIDSGFYFRKSLLN